jgi:hypothetical protein
MIRLECLPEHLRWIGRMILSNCPFVDEAWIASAFDNSDRLAREVTGSRAFKFLLAVHEMVTLSRVYPGRRLTLETINVRVEVTQHTLEMFNYDVAGLVANIK